MKHCTTQAIEEKRTETQFMNKNVDLHPDEGTTTGKA
jgi:hypothetical protein